MSVVKELYLQTNLLIEFIATPFPKDDDERDQFLASIDEQLAKREHYINQLDRHSLTDQEKQLGDELIKINKELSEHMDQLHLEIQANLAQLRTKKATGLKYENPFDGPTLDGVFFDKRGV